MTEERMRDIARGAIERNLGDVVDEDTSPDGVYDEAFVLAHDALLDAGVPADVATKIASELARDLAQP